MYILALWLSGSILTHAKETTGLKKGMEKISYSLLASRCKSLASSLPNSIFPRTWDQLQDTEALNPYVNFINDELLPTCNGRYQTFSSRFASFVDTGSFMLSEGKVAGQMGCGLKRKFKEVFHCEKKVLEANTIFAAAIDGNKQLSPAMQREQVLYLRNNLDFKLVSGVKAEFYAYQKAIAYVQQEMLQTSDFFQKTEAEILAFIKEIHRLVTHNQILNPGEFRKQAIIVNTFGADFSAMRDFLVKEYKPSDNELKAFDESVQMRKQMGLDASLKRFSKVQLELWKKIVGIPPGAELVPAAMQELVKKFKAYHLKKIHPIAIAAWLHCALVEIHPFEDGNGRTARLLMNTYLAFHGYQPVVFPDKLMYSKAVSTNQKYPGHFAKYLIRVINWNKQNIQNIG